jgi:Terpene cyclase DEP1
MTDTAAATSLPTSRKLLCVAYGAIAAAALISTWSQNIAYLHAGIARYFADFLAGVKATPASRTIACDIVFFFLAAGVFMVIEARKRGIRFVWAYIVAGILIDISVAFPLFLIARELKMGASDAPRLRVADTILLAVVAAAVVVVAQVDGVIG